MGADVAASATQLSREDVPRRFLSRGFAGYAALSNWEVLGDKRPFLVRRNGAMVKHVSLDWEPLTDRGHTWPRMWLSAW